MTVDELAREIGADVVGSGAQEVTGANTLEEAQAGQVSFLANAKYIKQLDTTGATAVIVAPSVVPNKHVTLLKTGDPYYAFMKAVVLLHGHRKHPHAGVHPAAHVDATATIGERTVIYPGAYVGPRVRIGRDCVIYPNATIYEDCVIGDRCIVHSGTSVGTDGYGYATHKGVHHKIPQVGNVIIEDDVEIGANCSIERAALGSTVIGTGTKIDQLVVIGHGCRIGAHCLLVAQVGIAGSVTLGHHVTLAGQAGVTGHLKIGNQVTIGAQSGVMADVDDQSTLVGSPAMPVSHARRVYMLFTQLPNLVERIKTLEQQVEELATGGAGGGDEGEDGAEVV